MHKSKLREYGKEMGHVWPKLLIERIAINSVGQKYHNLLSYLTIAPKIPSRGSQIWECCANRPQMLRAC